MGAAGDHFIVPRTPFRMAAFVIPCGSNFQGRALPIFFELRFKGKRVRDNDNPIYSDFNGWRELRARRLIRGVWGALHTFPQ